MYIALSVCNDAAKYINDIARSLNVRHDLQQSFHITLVGHVERAMRCLGSNKRGIDSFVDFLRSCKSFGDLQYRFTGNIMISKSTGNIQLEIEVLGINELAAAMSMMLPESQGYDFDGAYMHITIGKINTLPVVTRCATLDIHETIYSPIDIYCGS